MNRAERRRLERAKEKKTATYNVTRNQLEEAVQKSVQEELTETYAEGFADGVSEAMVLFLTLPMQVLKKQYWPKTYQKRLPEFMEQVLQLYDQWQNDELDVSQLKADLWNDAGIRLGIEDKEEEKHE